MAMYYGQPLTEEERRQQELQAMFGASPPGVDPYSAPMPPAAPAPPGPESLVDPRLMPAPGVADAALGVTDPSAQAMGGPPVPAERPDLPALPERPDPETMNWGQRLAIAMASLGDAFRAPMAGWTGQPIPTSGSQTAGMIQGVIGSRNAAADRNWQAEVQNALANRRLGIGEQQEGRAQSDWEQINSADSPMAKRMQTDMLRKVERGELPGVTAEQIRQMTPKEMDALGLQKEAGTYRGVQQNKDQADAAQQRRLDEAQMQVEFLRENGIEVAGDQATPEGVDKVFAKAMQDDRIAAAWARALLAARTRKKRGTGGGGETYVPGDIVKMDVDERAKTRKELYRLMSKEQQPTRRQFYMQQIKELNEIESYQIPGYRMTGRITSQMSTKANDIVSGISDARNAMEMMLDNAPRSAAEAARFIAKSQGKNIGLGSDEARRYDSFKAGAESMRSAYVKVREMGVPTGNDVERANTMSLSPDSWGTMASGQAPFSAERGYAQLKKDGDSKLKALHYEPDESADVAAASDEQLSPLTPDEQARLRELREKRRRAGGM